MLFNYTEFFAIRVISFHFLLFNRLRSVEGCVHHLVSLLLSVMRSKLIAPKTLRFSAFLREKNFTKLVHTLSFAFHCHHCYFTVTITCLLTYLNMQCKNQDLSPQTLPHNFWFIRGIFKGKMNRNLIL